MSGIFFLSISLPLYRFALVTLESSIQSCAIVTVGCTSAATPLLWWSGPSTTSAPQMLSASGKSPVHHQRRSRQWRSFFQNGTTSIWRAVEPDDRKWLLSQFQGRFTGISRLLTREPEIPQEPLLHFSSDYIIATHKHLGNDGIVGATKMSVEQLMAIQTATVGQKDNHLRHALRKGRLTASNFGSVLKKTTC